MTSRAKYDSIATSGVDDGGTISPPPRSPANLAALRLNLLCYSMTNLSPAAIFPFFAIVMAEKTPSKIMVGVIYASQPAMAFLVAPLVPRLTAKFGRIPVTCFGLVVAAAGCAGFGASSSVANWLLFHALEGVGNALIDVPASALLLAHSADIAEDLGLLEAVAGLAYVVGPVLGGILFSELGFETTLFILALLHLAVFTVVPFISKDLIAGETTPSDLASDDCESRRPGEKQLDSEVQEEVAPDRDVEGLLWSEKAVWVAALANTLAYAALSFTDIAISPQLQRTLGLGARARGFIYFVPAALYTGISPLNGELCRRWGARKVLLVGSLLWAVSLLICGPTPPLAENGGRTYEWVMVIVGLTLNGIAMAPVVQAPLPMVNDYFKLTPSTTASSSAGNSSALHRPFFNRTEKVRAEDAISAMMSATLSLGCTLGPIVGGVCLEFLPKTRDPGCREGPSLREISGNYAADPCTSAFGSTTTMLSGFFLLLAVAVVSIPGKPS